MQFVFKKIYSCFRFQNGNAIRGTARVYRPTINNGCAKGKLQKPSISDAQKEVILIAESMIEVSSILNQRKKENILLQPVIVIVGSLRYIEQILVTSDNHYYIMGDVLNAILLCFQIFFVFNLEYSVTGNS